MNDRKKLGADLPVEAVDRFVAYCESRGYQKSVAATAAFLLLEHATLELRDAAMRQSEDEIGKWFHRAQTAMNAEMRQLARDIVDQSAAKARTKQRKAR